MDDATTGTINTYTDKSTSLDFITAAESNYIWLGGGQYTTISPSDPVPYLFKLDLDNRGEGLRFEDISIPSTPWGKTVALFDDINDPDYVYAIYISFDLLRIQFVNLPRFYLSTMDLLVAEH